jgi:serine racemase
MNTYTVKFEDLLAARNLIKNYIHYTPILTSSHISKLASHNLSFKCENFQKTGSFKIRGALNAILNVKEKDPIIVTTSSGNHGQAVAYGSQLMNYQCHIVMPRLSPLTKKESVSGYGGKITLSDSSDESRKAVADELMRSLGDKSVFIPSSDHCHVIAGQGTMALEILEQVPDIDVIVASVGGGGMISGVALAAKHIKPSIKVIAAEPSAVDDCYRSFQAGILPISCDVDTQRAAISQLHPACRNMHISLYQTSIGKLMSNEPSAEPQTICDGLLINVKATPWEIIRQLVDGVITVTDSQVVHSMKLIMERMKIVVEPSAACALAAVFSPDFARLVGSDSLNVCVILCGGNLNLLKLSEIMSNDS